MSAASVTFHHLSPVGRCDSTGIGHGAAEPLCVSGLALQAVFLMTSGWAFSSVPAPSFAARPYATANFKVMVRQTFCSGFTAKARQLSSSVTVK